MAVVGSAKELWADRTAKFNGGIWTYTRAWLVQTNDKTDREDTVSAASGLPAYADAHPAPVADAAYAKEISYEPFVSESPLAWKVSVTYSSERDLNSSPDSDEVLVSWTSEIYQEPVFLDTSGNAILNSAGDYFIDPVPMRDAAHLIAKIKANVTSVPTWVIGYQNAVNNGAITIGGLSIATGLAKMQRLDIGERQVRGATTFYELSFEVHIHADGWRMKPLDVGFRELEYGDLVQIKDSNGDEVTTPVPLDGAGQALDNPTPSTAVFGDYTIYPEKDFTVLPGIS